MCVLMQTVLCINFSDYFSDYLPCHPIQTYVSPPTHFTSFFLCLLCLFDQRESVLLPARSSSFNLGNFFPLNFLLHGFLALASKSEYL